MRLKEKPNGLKNKNTKEKKVNFFKASSINKNQRDYLQTIIEEQQINLNNIENQIKQILNDTYTKNHSEKIFDKLYINLMNDLDYFLEQCQSLKEQVEYLHLEEYYSKIRTLAKNATNYKKNFPATKELACQYVDKKVYRLYTIKFKAEETRFITSINSRLNNLLINANKMNEQTYHDLLKQIQKDIESHEQAYSIYYDFTTKYGFKEDLESFNKLYNDLQSKKIILNTPYYNVRINDKKSFSTKKITELKQQLAEYNQKLANLESLRNKEALLLIEAKIDATALLNSLTYFVNNFDRITNETTEKIVMTEAEILECSVRSKEITKEIIRLSKVERTNTKYQVEQNQKAKLTRLQQEIKLEKEAKELELALLTGEDLEIKQSSQSSKSSLITSTAKLLKLEKQLLELEKLGQIRNDIYLNLKVEYIDTIKEVTSLKYYDEHKEQIKTPLDQDILTVKQNIEGLLAKKKVASTEMFRIYGLKSLTKLNATEYTCLNNYEIQIASIKKEIFENEVKLVPLLSKKEEEEYLENHQASNTIEQKLVSKQAYSVGISKYLEELERLGFVNTSNYLDAKLKSIDIQYDITSLKYYIDYLPKALTPRDLEVLRLNAEVNGHMARAIAIENELERLTQLPNTINNNPLKSHIITLKSMHKHDSKESELKKVKQETITKVIDFNSKKESIHDMPKKSKIKSIN